MARIPFKSEYRSQIESGEYKVVTDCGEPVEIVKWDCKGEYPILAVIDKEDMDKISSYDVNGSSNFGNGIIYAITNEPDMTEFEQAVEEKIRNMVSKAFSMDINITSKEFVHNFAWELVTIAEAEVKKDWRKFLSPQEVTDIYNEGYNKGFVDGKAEALKDIPKWKNNWMGHTEEPCISTIYGYDNEQLCIDDKIIDIKELWDFQPREENTH